MTRKKPSPEPVKPWERPLWFCPRCGKPFVTRNLSHSCRIIPLERHFENRPVARVLFDALIAALEEKGPVIIVPNKTSIAIMTRVRFAQAMPRKDYLRVRLWLKRRVDSPRIVRTEEYGAQGFGPAFELRAVSEIDDEIRGLLYEAREIGDQDHLKNRPGR